MSVPFRAVLVCTLVSLCAGAWANPAAGRITLAYNFAPGHALRYRLIASVKGTAPLFDSPTPVDLDAKVTLVYIATPRALAADGSADVEFHVDSGELVISGLPWDVPVEQLQKIFDQTVTFSPTGAVKQIRGGEPLPFNVTIPGVDPKRLYAMIFPVVFQSKPVAPGQSWAFTSELLGGQGTQPTFTATLVPASAGSARKIAQLNEKFAMPVRQDLDQDKKPVKPGDKPYRTRSGEITGKGDLTFDRRAGLFTHSRFNIKAHVADDLVGEPASPEDPKHLATDVEANVTVDLEPARQTPAAPAGTEKADKR